MKDFVKLYNKWINAMRWCNRQLYEGKKLRHHRERYDALTEEMDRAWLQLTQEERDAHVAHQS